MCFYKNRIVCIHYPKLEAFKIFFIFVILSCSYCISYYKVDNFLYNPRTFRGMCVCKNVCVLGSEPTVSHILSMFSAARVHAASGFLVLIHL